MKRLLLIAALLVASAAPSWAQSDTRWFAIFNTNGYVGKGYSRSTGGGDRMTRWMAEVNHVARTIMDRTGTKVKIFSLPDSGMWAATIGTARLPGEADSVWFRRAGCFGWMMTYDLYSSSFNGAGYSGEGTAYFTGTGSTKGTFACSPMSGLWGIPGVVFTGSNGIQSNSGQGFFCGITSTAGASGVDRERQAFANGDSISMAMTRQYRIGASEVANVIPIIYTGDTLNATGYDVAAWQYKNTCLYYGVGSNEVYASPTPIMLGLADVFNRAGFTVKRKINLKIDLDHPFPDATVQTAPSDSFFAYMDANPQWRLAGPVESHSTEIANDNATLAEKWKARSNTWPGHPHSHEYLNFGQGNGPSASAAWDFSTFSDSALKRQRWNDMEKMISDTLGYRLQKGIERTATFPNNDVNRQDLYIMASGGYYDIRSKAIAGSDSFAVEKRISLRRWNRVTGPRTYTSPISNYGLPYAYLEPKTNKVIYVHDSVEHPGSAESTHVSLTDHSVSMEGFAQRNLAGMVRMAIWDGGQYWHPDLNVTGDASGNGKGRFMADFYRRLTYFYGRTKNLMEITPVYKPKTPRVGPRLR